MMKLPPMNSLRAFEAASRHLSVSKAAEELCVSQGAVSQQLRNLEDHLGRELFIRSPNSFTLSEDGETFAAVVQQSLQEIAHAAGEVAGEKAQRTLTISMSPNLAVKWLMPKLGDFYQAHPDVSVSLHHSVSLVTFKNDGVDAAIRSGDGHFDGLDSVLLIRMQLFAVASPAYIAENGKLESLAKPGKHRLIEHHYASKDVRSQHIHWEDVVEGNLVDPRVEHLIYPDEYQALNAAIQGQGIALIAANMVEEEIETGEVEYANEQSVPARYNYYFVSPTDARPNIALDAFRDWLLDQSIMYRDE
jgi:LysR family glycine cleavage system transcriptional activator